MDFVMCYIAGFLSAIIPTAILIAVLATKRTAQSIIADNGS